MARTGASTAKRRKSPAGATPTAQSTQADGVHDSTPAANAIGCCVDLLTEILLLLPAKSLIRFRCVSKNWLSLISDFEFACKHSRRNPRPNPSGLFFYCGTLVMELESVSFHSDQNLPPLPTVGAIGRLEGLTKIADSCNGLLLCENIGHDDECNDLAGRYAVCNVSTQKYRVLPKPEGNAYRWYHTAFLAFDPSKSPHYKVVLVSYRGPPPYEIDVFSSQTGCWNKVFAQHTCYDGLGAYWNGAIHWVDDENCLRFDVDAEEMIATPTRLPPRILSPDKIRYLGECGGRLFLIQSRSRKVLGFRILKFHDHGRWCGSYQVNLRPLISEFPDIETAFEFDVLSLFCAGDVKKKEDFTLVLAIPGRIIAYNLHSKTYDKLFDLPEGFSVRRHGNGYAHPFIETLSPV